MVERSGWKARSVRALPSASPYLRDHRHRADSDRGGQRYKPSAWEGTSDIQSVVHSQLDVRPWSASIGGWQKWHGISGVRCAEQKTLRRFDVSPPQLRDRELYGPYLPDRAKPSRHGTL